MADQRKKRARAKRARGMDTKGTIGKAELSDAELEKVSGGRADLEKEEAKAEARKARN